MSASYREIPSLIKARAPFTGNSMSATVGRGSFISKGRGSMTVPREADYVVFSYSTPIGYAIGDALFVTSESFSVTTSRQQNILRSLGAKEVNPF